ncbi:MAG: DM13 domain-containing protein [Sporichthyaceae bacterium]
MPESARRVTPAMRVTAVPLVVIIVALGIWITGAVVTDDATAAMVLTGLWLALAGAVALVVSLRWRQLAWPVVGAYAVSAAAIGGYLFYTSSVDKVVDEKVVVAAPRATASTPPPAGAASVATTSAPAGPVEVASGKFTNQAHDTSGRATLVEQPNGDRFLTLTRFKTDPGPDVRVYLVPDPGGSITDAVDLGKLKGNKGNQQYDVPAGTEAGAVVIWCRAFTVAFGTATLS